MISAFGNTRKGIDPVCSLSALPVVYLSPSPRFSAFLFKSLLLLNIVHLGEAGWRREYQHLTTWLSLGLFHRLSIKIWGYNSLGNDGKPSPSNDGSLHHRYRIWDT